MALLNDFRANVNEYDPLTTSVERGIRAGKFWLSGERSPGIPIGNVLASMLYWTLGGTQAITTATGVAAGTLNYFIPLSGINLAGFATVVEENGETFVRLDAPRLLSLATSNSSINVVFSCRDQYGEPMTFGNNPSSSITSASKFTSPRCALDILSIKISNVGGATANITINIEDGFELPYYNWGTTSHILTISTPTSDTNPLTVTSMPLMKAPTPGAIGDPITYNCTFINPTSNPINPGLTLYSGTVRPIMTGFPTTDAANIPPPYIIEQAVFGYGTLPDWIDPTIRQTLINGSNVIASNLGDPKQPVITRNNIGIIGGVQYKTNWKGWQG
jgi:hypothetical protein